jgi:hypothetical protein
MSDLQILYYSEQLAREEDLSAGPPGVCGP